MRPTGRKKLAKANRKFFGAGLNCSQKVARIDRKRCICGSNCKQQHNAYNVIQTLGYFGYSYMPWHGSNSYSYIMGLQHHCPIYIQMPYYVNSGVVVRERGGAPFWQIFWSRNGAQANITIANTEVFWQIMSYSLG